MSGRTLRWTQRALRRLDEIGAYIERDDPPAAARVVSRIVSAAEALLAQPAMGREGRVKGTRERVLSDIPYIIAYRIGANGIDILTVLHAAQKWPQAF